MTKLYAVLFFMYFMTVNAACIAQAIATEDDKQQMAVGMRSNGKIYVVVAVVVTILLGMIVYLISLDRKITRLEKDIKSL